MRSNETPLACLHGWKEMFYDLLKSVMEHSPVLMQLLYL